MIDDLMGDHVAQDFAKNHCLLWINSGGCFAGDVAF